jgi:hypothetical protein
MCLMALLRDDATALDGLHGLVIPVPMAFLQMLRARNWAILKEIQSAVDELAAIERAD